MTNDGRQVIENGIILKCLNYLLILSQIVTSKLENIL